MRVGMPKCSAWSLPIFHVSVPIFPTLGFTTKELAAALSRVEAGLTDEDEVPEVAEVAVSRPGDVWQLGPHRIACGDSRDAGLVQSSACRRRPRS